MPCCVLRVYGRNFDAEGFLAASDLVIDTIHRRGERRSASSVHEMSGFTVLASEADGNQFQQQVQDAIALLRSRGPELARLRSYPGVEGVTLDFGCDFPFKRVCGRYFCLPLELVKECAALHVEIEISVYGVDKE
jgi:hypothetical protein